VREMVTVPLAGPLSIKPWYSLFEGHVTSRRGRSQRRGIPNNSLSGVCIEDMHARAVESWWDGSR